MMVRPESAPSAPMTNAFTTHFNRFSQAILHLDLKERQVPFLLMTHLRKGVVDHHRIGSQPMHPRRTDTMLRFAIRSTPSALLIFRQTTRALRGHAHATGAGTGASA